MKKGLYLILEIKFFAYATTAVFAVMIIAVACIADRTVQANAGVNFKPVIIIDAGHGGEDGGTQSASGVLEKDINLLISKKLESVLKADGFETVMVRTDDELIYDENSTTMRSKKSSDIHNRLALMEKYPGCIFLSIHQNYFTQSKYSGAQVFYRPNHSESSVLAQSIQQSIISSLQKENTRQIKPCTSSVYLIYNAVSTAVMVECGFLSNEQEAKNLNNDDYQTKMALAIANGLKDYLQTKGSG